MARTALAQDVRSGVEQLAEQIIKVTPQGRDLRIAVLDFPDLLNVTSDLGRFVANRLTTRLSQSQKFFVVERQRLSQVLSELRFSMTDLVDPEKAKQLGKMVGVEAVVVGTVSDLGNQVDLDARVIEIETSRTLVSVSATISRDQVVSQLMERGRVEALPPTPTSPPSVQAQPQQPVTAARSTGHQTASSRQGSSGSSFQNSFLRVTYKSLGKSPDKKSINLVLQFENISEEHLLLAVRKDLQDKFNGSLVDDNGNVFVLSRLNGLSEAYTHFGYQSLKEKYTSITPGASHAVVMIFESKQEFKGNSFSFSTDCFRYIWDDKVKRGNAEQFSIGIANLRTQ
jgi:TolB-like protein